MRLRSIFAALVTLALPALSHATPITYDLTLTANPGSLYGGTGAITLATAPSTTTVSTYTLSSGLTSLDFILDGQTFDLANENPGSSPTVQFTDGKLTDITFAATDGVSPNRFAIATSGTYAFSYSNELATSYGTFSAAVAPATPAVTPEPSSFILLGTGLLGVAGVMRKRLA